MGENTFPNREGERGPLSANQQRVFDELRAAGAFGRNDESLPNWLDFVRRRPSVADWLLGELRYAQVSRVIQNPGAWMMSLWIHKGRPNA